MDIDIKGFFDNVIHAKLLKQMWAFGIQDKNLISVIGKILKSEITGIGIPEKAPQGEIISPLLSNIVLNELDWWLSDQWETFNSRYPYAHRNKFRLLRESSNLKEFFFVRCADDAKILCKDYKTAQKIFIATKNWLKERLGLEISPEKSRITNVQKGKTEFLGFALYTKKNRNKYYVRSNIADKAKKAITNNLKEQIKYIQRHISPHSVNVLNSKILGMHNYYSSATLSSIDFNKITLSCCLNRNRTEDNQMKGYFLITGSYRDSEATAKLNAIRNLVEPATAAKIEYDIIYSHYHKARSELFAKLPYMVCEAKSFPLFEEFKSVANDIYKHDSN